MAEGWRKRADNRDHHHDVVRHVDRCGDRRGVRLAAFRSPLKEKEGGEKRIMVASFKGRKSSLHLCIVILIKKFK